MEKDIIKELSEFQKVRDKVLIEIGLLYANNVNSLKDKSLVSDLNDKVLVYQKIVDRLNKLEDEINGIGIA
jgi:hypothetical protein